MTPQKFDHAGKKTLITGTSGTGKTTLFESLIRGDKARWKFIFDHQGEFSRRFDVEAAFDLDQLCAAAGGQWCVFDPVRMFPGKTAEAFRFFCDFAFAMSQSFKGRKIFACDELQKLTSPKIEHPELLTILDTGRRFQLDFYGICQAPNRIHNAIRNQLTLVYTFRQSDANAVAYLSENGFSADEIRALPRGRYLWRNLDSGETGAGGEAF